MERWALLVYFILYFSVGFVWRSWQVWRNSGLNPYVLPASDDAQGYAARGFRYVLIGLAAYTLVQAAWPQADVLLGRLGWLDHPAVSAAAWLLLLLSFAWVCVAQAQMGSSWRIGMDMTHATALVCTGLFRLSRNPIFLAMRASLLGLLLLRPNAVTLALAVAGELLMQVQVRQEEVFLTNLHGEDYAAYCRRTRRWL